MKVVLVWSGIVAAAVLAAWGWAEWAWVSTHSDEIARALTFLTFVGSFLVFLSVILTVSQFRTTQKQAVEVERAQRIAKLDALLLEINVNRGACIALSKISPSAESVTVPEARFETGVLQLALAAGSLSGEPVRQLLWNVYIQLLVSNRLLNRALDVMYFEHIADPRNSLSQSGRETRIRKLESQALTHINTLSPLLDQAADDLTQAIRVLGR